MLNPPDDRYNNPAWITSHKGRLTGRFKGTRGPYVMIQTPYGTIEELVINKGLQWGFEEFYTEDPLIFRLENNIENQVDK